MTDNPEAVLTVRHPKWWRFLTLPLLIFIQILGTTPIVWLIAIGYPYPAGYVFVAAIFLATCWFVRVGLDLHRFRHVSVEIRPDGVVWFGDKRGTSELRSDEIAFLARDRLKMLYIFQKDTGQKLAVFDYCFPGATDLVAWAKENLDVLKS